MEEGYETCTYHSSPILSPTPRSVLHLALHLERAMSPSITPPLWQAISQQHTPTSDGASMTDARTTELDVILFHYLVKAVDLILDPPSPRPRAEQDNVAPSLADTDAELAQRLLFEVDGEGAEVSSPSRASASWFGLRATRSPCFDEELNLWRSFSQLQRDNDVLPEVVLDVLLDASDLSSRSDTHGLVLLRGSESSGQQFVVTRAKGKSRETADSSPTPPDRPLLLQRWKIWLERTNSSADLASSGEVFSRCKSCVEAVARAVAELPVHRLRQKLEQAAPAGVALRFGARLSPEETGPPDREAHLAWDEIDLESFLSFNSSSSSSNASASSHSHGGSRASALERPPFAERTIGTIETPFGRVHTSVRYLPSPDFSVSSLQALRAKREADLKEMLLEDDYFKFRPQATSTVRRQPSTSAFTANPQPTAGLSSLRGSPVPMPVSASPDLSSSPGRTLADPRIRRLSSRSIGGRSPLAPRISPTAIAGLSVQSYSPSSSPPRAADGQQLDCRLDGRCSTLRLPEPAQRLRDVRKECVASCLAAPAQPFHVL